MIVDADAHLLEFLPLVRDIAVQEGGAAAADAMMARIVKRSGRVREQSIKERQQSGTWRGAWWGAPAENSVDLATVTLPGLLHSRMDSLGIDYQIVYPSLGLLVFLEENAELRRLMARTFNRYYSEVLAGFGDRLLAAGVIPMHTPEEAVSELDWVVNELGYRSVIMTGVVPRLQASGAQTIEPVAFESCYDYDEVWEACSRLRVAPTFHGTGMGWGSRTSPNNYVYNHLGSFAAANEATCRAIVMGGAAARFKDLNWIFLEGGVLWAAQLRQDLREHFEKRGRDSIRQYDPSRVDRDFVTEMFRKHATGRLAEYDDPFGGDPSYLSDPADGDRLLDDFSKSGIGRVSDVDDMFDRFYFGCEADDVYAVLAFDTKISQRSPQLNALFSSDIGHWDVPNAQDVVPGVSSLHADGLLDDDAYAALTHVNVIRAHGGMRDDFFDGTRVSQLARDVLRPNEMTS